MSQAAVLVRVYMTIQLIRLYMTIEIVRLYGKCHEGCTVMD